MPTQPALVFVMPVVALKAKKKASAMKPALTKSKRKLKVVTDPSKKKKLILRSLRDRCPNLKRRVPI